MQLILSGSNPAEETTIGIQNSMDGYSVWFELWMRLWKRKRGIVLEVVVSSHDRGQTRILTERCIDDVHVSGPVRERAEPEWRRIRRESLQSPALVEQSDDGDEDDSYSRRDNRNLGGGVIIIRGIVG